MKWLALDIGGANLKLANGLGYAASHSFKMWKNAPQLAAELRTVIAEAPPADHLAITMTGELADCFESRTEGVHFIIHALEKASDGRHLRVYLTNGDLVTTQVALQNPLQAASSNWHAWARFAGRYAKQGTALLIDVGSTTTDIIPLLDGIPAHTANNDLDRLLSSELVYTGIERSPICALIDSTPYRGHFCPLAQEVFATSRDAYLILKKLVEDESNLNTTDGRPASRAAAQIRMGRLIGATGEQFTATDAQQMAELVLKKQTQLIATAIQQVASRQSNEIQTVVISGHGSFLAQHALNKIDFVQKVVLLENLLGQELSRCAPAHGLAVLAREGQES